MCLFCEIVKGEVASKKVYEDKVSFAFFDINPQAPSHIIIIPRKHLEVLSLKEEDKEVLGHLFLVAKKIAQDLGLDKEGPKAPLGGFRIILNCGESAGQTVSHLHLHLLGGRRFSWPPG